MPSLPLRTPAYRLLSLLLFLAGALGLVLFLAKNQLRTGHSFQVGDRITVNGQTETLQALDLTPEPGEITDATLLDRFYARQGVLSTLLSAPDLTINETPQIAQKTHLGTLPLIFWIQLYVGFGSCLIAGWVWALKPQSWGPRLFALSGGATLLFTSAAALYTTRELALSQAMLHALTSVNEAGASLFGICTLGLFLIYPVKLRNCSRWMTLQVGFFGLWTLAALLDLIPPALRVNFITLVEMIGIIVAIGFQFRATRGRPEARAALTWLGVSVLLGAGFFIAMTAAPLVLGQDASIEQGYAFLSFLLIYLGLAAGLVRFRLFEVGRWAFQLLFYGLGVSLLLGLDTLLVIGIGLGRLPALSLAFFAVGLLYLPLRDALRQRLRPNAEIKAHELLEEALSLAFTHKEELRLQNWHATLYRLFAPLEIVNAQQDVSEPLLDQDGLVLMLPRVAQLPPLKLSYRSSGHRLFHRDDQRLASYLISLVKRLESSRAAYDRGAAEERRRVAQDLHDDVGARLLSAIQTADQSSQAGLKDVLSELRGVVHEMAHETLSWDELYGELRFECLKRLDAVGIELIWPPLLDENTMSEPLNYPLQKALRSSLRELVSNIIRHAEATHVDVQLKADAKGLSLRISDDGKGLPATLISGEAQARGFGLRSLKLRLASMGGSVTYISPAKGCTVLLTMPWQTSHAIPPKWGVTGPAMAPKLNRFQQSGIEVQHS